VLNCITPLFSVLTDAVIKRLCLQLFGAIACAVRAKTASDGKARVCVEKTMRKLLSQLRVIICDSYGELFPLVEKIGGGIVKADAHTAVISASVVKHCVWLLQRPQVADIAASLASNLLAGPARNYSSAANAALFRC
jgi:hypothetical protein